MKARTFVRNVKFSSWISLVTCVFDYFAWHTYVSSFFQHKSNKNALRFEIFYAKYNSVFAICWHHHSKHLRVASSTCMAILKCLLK